MPSISQIRIPRWTGFTPQNKLLEIHGFADASKFAYGAVVYLRLIKDHVVSVSLQLAKTRVAPLKILSIPRLELSASLMLARLVHHFQTTLPLKIDNVHLWTDSADVLFWLKYHPARWGVFVANRCSEIHTLLPHAYWHHVRLADNPADVILRGIEPSRLANHELWWKGPAWLSSSTNPWSQVHDDLNFSVHSLISRFSLIQNSHKIIATPVVAQEEVWDLMSKYSHLSKLLRISAYCLRFILSLCYKLKAKATQMPFKSINLQIVQLFEQTEYEALSERRLRSNDVNNSLYLCTYLVQKVYFKEELRQLLAHSRLISKSSLLKLNPVIERGLIKVGGRLSNSLLEEEAKHPFILPSSCPLTTSFASWRGSTHASNTSTTFLGP